MPSWRFKSSSCFQSLSTASELEGYREGRCGILLNGSQGYHQTKVYQIAFARSDIAADSLFVRAKMQDPGDLRFLTSIMQRRSSADNTVNSVKHFGAGSLIHFFGFLFSVFEPHFTRLLCSHDLRKDTSDRWFRR